jgi:hypothetical protein
MHPQPPAWELFVAPPAPGSWRAALSLEHEVPGGLMQLAIQGLPAPLELTLRQREDVAAFAIVVSAPAPRDEAADGLLAEPGAPPRPAPLPALVAAGAGLGAQLVAPRPGAWLESDRGEAFEVALPAGSGLRGRPVLGVAVGAEGCGWTELAPRAAAQGGSTGNAAAQLWAGDMVLPRRPGCSIVARLGPAAAGSGSGGGASSLEAEMVELLRLPVAPQAQHVVAAPGPPPPPAPDPCAPDTQRWAATLSRLDADGDGAASRGDVLRAVRRDRQLADLLRLPPRIRVSRLSRYE